MDEVKKLYDLKIDHEFMRLIYPLSKTDLMNLENHIKHFGCNDGIRVWNSCVVIDFDKYLLCHKYKKPFSLIKIPTKERTEVIAYICEEQSRREDIPREMFKYLVGKRYISEKLLGNHLASSLKRTDKKRGRPPIHKFRYDLSGVQTRDRLSKEYHMSAPTVFKYGLFSQKLDELYAITPKLAESVVFGVTKIGHEQLIDLMKLPSEKLSIMEKSIMESQNKIKSYTQVRDIIQDYVILSQEADKKKNNDNDLKISIKDMPDYDPNLEFSSLALTIPSWIASINRTKEKGFNSGVTLEKRHQLEKELCNLRNVVESLIIAIREME